MNLEILDYVELIKDTDLFKKGTKGTIVHFYASKVLCEVEIIENGKTAGVFTMKPENLKKVS